jgi:membrane protease YdiL (CAAX protease family)
VTELEKETPANATANALQILLVFFVAALIVWGGWKVVGENAFARQAVAWVANVAMLVTIWVGLRARRQTWEHLGLRRRFGGGRAVLRTVLQSMAVLVFALAGFVAGSMLATNLAPAPENADMSGYGYLLGNLPMLLVALAAVYVVSSFGEEVVYRGFLMTRLSEIGKGTRAARGAAVVISAIVFGLAHFNWGIVGIIQTTLMGVALSVSYLLVGRNLWVLVFAHAYIDTVLLVQMYLGPSASGE